MYLDSTQRHNKKLTKDIVNERLIHRGIKMVGDYINARTKTLFKCDKGHEWITQPHLVVKSNPTGCPTCVGSGVKLTKHEIDRRLGDKGIIVTGEYTNTSSRTSFKCLEGHEWTTQLGAVMYRTGCPECAFYGFNASLPAYAYVLDFGDFIKYGISNSIDVRLSKHRRSNGNFTVVETRYYEKGADALSWERTVKQTFGGHYVNKDRCSDGYTETLSKELLTELMEIR